MSIFKKTFHKFIQKQIKLRESVLGGRDGHSDSDLVYMNSKTAWVRLTSSVDITSERLAKLLNVSVGNELAKKFILQAGTLDYNKDKNSYSLRYGIGDGGGSYGDSEIFSRNEFGLRPMAGITDVSVQSQGAYGSLRTATVNFKCWTKQQLDALELLYMRNGYTLLLEFGWSMYYDNNKKLINTPSYYNILDSKLEKEQIFNDIYSVSEDYIGGDGTVGRIEKSAGNYDALFGYVKNFSHKRNSFNGYDCSVDIVTIGEVLNSLKINYTSKDTPERITNNAGLSYDSKKSFYSSKLVGILDYIKKLQKDVGGIGYVATLNRNNKPIHPYSDIIKYNSNDSFQTFIRIIDLVRILNEEILLSDGGGKPFVKLSTRSGAKRGQFPSTEQISPNLCYAHYLQFSTNPSVCLIKPCDNKNLLPEYLKYKFLKEDASFSVMNADEYQYFQSDSYKRGVIENIFVNIDYIKKCLKSTEKDMTVFLDDFLRTLLKGIQESLGNINNFDLIVEHNTGTIQIVDLKYLEDDQFNIENDRFVMNVSGLSTIVRELSLESSIFPNQSSIIGIAASNLKTSGETGVNTMMFDSLNIGLSDRVISNKVEPSYSSPVEDNIKDVAANIGLSSVTALRDYISKLNANTPFVIEELPPIEALNNLILYEIALQDRINGIKNYSSKSILPLVLSMTIDGISGIQIGQIFRLPTSELPLSFQDFENSSFKTGFIVTRVGSQIRGNDWVTNIEAQTCILDDFENKTSKSKKVDKALIFDYVSDLDSRINNSELAEQYQQQQQFEQANIGDGVLSDSSFSYQTQYGAINATVADIKNNKSTIESKYTDFLVFQLNVLSKEDYLGVSNYIKLHTRYSTLKEYIGIEINNDVNLKWKLEFIKTSGNFVASREYFVRAIPK